MSRGETRRAVEPESAACVAEDGRAPGRFGSPQTTDNNDALREFKDMLEGAYGRAKGSRALPEESWRGHVQEAGRVADHGGQEAMLRHITGVLGVKLRWGHPGERRPQHFFTQGGKRVFGLIDCLSPDAVKALVGA